MIRNGRMLLFAGLIVAPVVRQTRCPMTGRIYTTHTLTNMAALKHFGGSRPAIAANDNWQDQRAG